MRLLHIVALGLLLLAAATRPAHAGGDGCNNIRVGQVDARVEYGGEIRRCGVGVGLLGIEVSFFGPKCPEYKFTYPSHQECIGYNYGWNCVYDSNMAVSKERCKCTFVGLLGTGLAIPECECEDAGDAGHIQDMKGGPC